MGGGGGGLRKIIIREISGVENNQALTQHLTHLPVFDLLQTYKNNEVFIYLSVIGQS